MTMTIFADRTRAVPFFVVRLKPKITDRTGWSARYIVNELLTANCFTTDSEQNELAGLFLSAR